MSQHIQQPDEDEVAEVPVWRQPKVLLIGGLFALAVLFILTRGKPEPKEDDTKSSPQAFIGDVVPYQPTKPDPPPPPVQIAQAPPPPAAPTLPVLPPAPQLRLTPGPTAPKVQRPAMLSYAAPPPPPATGGAAGAKAEPPATSVIFKGGDIPGGKASSAIDTTYVLMPGLLPCVLDTAISSEVPSGSLMCHLPGPVYSQKGVVLLEAGTQIIGKYEGLKGGENRLQAVSTYAVTPNGIFVPITDNMSDDLGRTGLDGNVNHRYFERFGAAILLNLSQSALSIIQASVSRGGNTYLDISSGGGVGGLAQQILQSTINLPPIFTKPQGSTIAIFLSEPIDFSNSYRLRQVTNAQR